MLTIEEVLSDVAASPGFCGVENVGVNSRGRNGESPLHWMATLGDVNGVRLLLEANSSINAADNQGNTPLHEAVASRQTLVVQLLIGKGADLYIRNLAGLTPEDLAKSDGFSPTIELFISAK